MKTSDINPFALPSVPLEMFKQLPTTPAIYFAINTTGTIQYIGRSTNLQERWVNHHRYSQLASISNVKIAWLDVSSPELLPEIEKALIDWFQPPLNRVGIRTGVESEKITVTVVLTQKEKERLKCLAEAQDRSLSYLAGKFVREGLERAENGGKPSNRQ